jgi:hypothetical protein
MADDKKQDDAPLNAVVITREFTDDGNFTVAVGATGDVKQTEIGDVLAYALRTHRQGKLGV